MAQVSDYVNVVIRGDSTKLVASLRNAGRATRRLAVGAQQVGMAFAALAAVSVKAVKDVMSVTLSLDDALRKMAGKMNADFTGSEFQGIIEDVEYLGSILPVTTTEVANVGVALAAMGVKGRDNMKSMMEMSVKLSRALDTDAVAAANLLFKTMSQFDIPDGIADKAEFVANQLTYLANNSAADAESIAESYKMIGSVSEQLSLSLIQVNKMLAVSSNVNLSGSQAGRTGVTAMIKMFTDPKAAAALDKWDVKFKKIINSGGGIVEVSHAMKNSLDELGATTAQRAKAWNDLFGKVGMKFGLALVSESEANIKKWEEGAMRAVDTVERAYQTMEGGTGGQVRLLKSAWEAFQISVGRGMEKYLAVMSAGLVEQLLIAREWMDSNPAAAVDLLATAVMSVVTAIGLIGTAMAAIGFASFLSSMASIVGILLSLSPLGMVLIAAGGALLYFKDSIDAVSGEDAMWSKTFEILKEGFETFRTAIHNAMLMISQGDWDLAFKQITNAAIVFADEMIKALTPLVEWLADMPIVSQLLSIGGLVGRGGSMLSGATREMITAGHGASARERFERLGNSRANRSAYMNWDDLGSYKDVGKETIEAMERGEDGVEAFNSAMARAAAAQEKYISNGYAMEEQSSSWKKIAEEANGAVAAGELYSDALLEMKKARVGLSDEERKALGEKQANILQADYGYRAAEALRKQVAAEQAAREEYVAKWTGVYDQVASHDWGSWWASTTDEENPFNSWITDWKLGAEETKKIIESISFGKLGDFDSGTAISKMNQKLNDTQENQLKELQSQTGILKEIRDKDVPLGGLIIN